MREDAGKLVLVNFKKLSVENSYCSKDSNFTYVNATNTELRRASRLMSYHHAQGSL